MQLRLILLLLLFLFPLVTRSYEFKNAKVKFSYQELKLLRFELINIDLQLRSIASLLSGGSKNGLNSSLALLSSFRSERQSKNKVLLKRIKAKLQKKNLLNPLLRLQTKAYAMYSLTKKWQKRRWAYDWAILDKKYSELLSQSRAFFQKSGIHQ